MAGDWIKMRTDLYRDPKVIAIADHLLEECSDLANYVRQNVQRDMTVTRNVMRNVTVGALVAIWGITRHQGHRENDDLVLFGAGLSVIDDIAELPGFGVAMESAGWVARTEQGLCFPKFFEEHNVDPTEEQRQKNNDRQRRFRDKKRNVTVTLPVTPKVTLEKRESREEFKEDLTTLSLLAKYHEIGGVKKVRKLTKERLAKHRARSRDPEWPKLFLEALGKLPIPGDGWQPDFDWLIDNETNVLKVLEGKYDWRAERDSQPIKRKPTRISG